MQEARRTLHKPKGKNTAIPMQQKKQI
jgi:hypothetical protein